MKKDNVLVWRQALSLNIKSMNTITDSSHIRQEKSQTKSIIYILELIQKCPKTFKKILAVLLKMDNLYKIVRPSEEWLSRQAGCCRVQVSRVVQALMAAGIITIVNNGFIPARCAKGIVVEDYRWSTNIYKFNPLIYDHDIRAKLAALLPGCQALEFSLLMLFENQLLERNVTLLRPYYEYEVIGTSKCKEISDSKEAKFQKGRTMTLPSRNEMVRSIESLKNTPLSQADVTAIASYTDEVLAYADRALQKKGTLANPIGYFLVCCREFNKKRLANGVNQSSRLETRRESPQKGRTPSSSSLEGFEYHQKMIENKERIDTICKDELHKTQLESWTRSLEDEKTPAPIKDALRLLIKNLADKQTPSR